MMNENKYRVFPFYFPQFYPTPENDRWWGEGFTDWELVKKATSINSAQRQPRIPLDGYYDQSKSTTIAHQCKLAKQYGIAGFNFYHYWFDGQVLLDDPINNLYNDKTIEIEYFVTWANETWTRQWIGRPDDILIKQEHKAEESLWREHYNYLRKFFHDSRYVKVNNKPIISIYRAELIKKLPEWISFINKLAREDGFDGVHLIALRAYEIADAQKIYKNFDMIVNFQPRYAINSQLKEKSLILTVVERMLRRLPENLQLKLGKLYAKKSYREYKYSEYISSMKSDDSTFEGKPVYPIVFPDWDNAPRYKERATFFSGVSVEKFHEALVIAKEKVSSHNEKFIFINAWNEWSEGAYIEPDTINNHRVLETIYDTFKQSQ